MSVTKKTAYFNSSSGGGKIYCKIWQNTEKMPVGILQIAHGTFNHIDFFEPLACFLADKGFIVCGNDHIGHGKSGSPGFTAQKDGHKRIIEDMHILSGIMKNRYSNELPYFLLGDSTGSLAARAYCAYFGEELSGAIFSAVGDLNDLSLMIETPVKRLAGRLGADSPVSLFGKAMTNRLVFGLSPDSEWLCKKTEALNLYKLDELCNFNITYSYLRDIIMLSALCSNEVWAKKIPPEMPILLIGGALDPLNSNGRRTIGVCDRLGKVGIIPEVILYPGCLHDILNESESENVYNDILRWLCEKL